MTNGKKGFTLIEILIVVAIIAILASVVLVGLGPTQQAGRDARRLSDIREVQNGLELYYNKCGYYPGVPEASSPCSGYQAANYWGVGSPAPSGVTAPSGMTAALVGSNIGISTVPDDPQAGKTYYYGANGAGSGYIVAATLENGANTVFNSYTPPSLTGYTVGGATTAGSNISSCSSPNYCLTL